MIIRDGRVFCFPCWTFPIFPGEPPMTAHENRIVNPQRIVRADRTIRHNGAAYSVPEGVPGAAHVTLLWVTPSELAFRHGDRTHIAPFHSFVAPEEYVHA